ncbi:MAG: hypothetical protein NTV55_04855 [Planctomycetota bacterium]|nr:hypothetical protein [Planctomycetota bacterium]
MDWKSRGIVRGKVKTGGKLLTTGNVMFVNKDGISTSSTISVDGEYNMVDAPLGECTVTVVVNKLPTDPGVRARLSGKGSGPKMPEGPKMPGTEVVPDSPPLPSAPSIPKIIVPIDDKYAKPETSGLKFTVIKGEQTYDIEL